MEQILESPAESDIKELFNYILSISCSKRIDKLGILTEDDLKACLEDIRRKRVQEMKLRQQKMQQWKINVIITIYIFNFNFRMESTEIAEKKDFLEMAKKSSNFVCHFYRDDFFRCKVIDKHLNILARKHMETKFCKINAEKCPFLTERLRIKTLPTLALVKDAKTKDYVVGFGELGNTDDFTTEVLEWRIAHADVIE
ncbi:thioredoxin domain-containing protein 9-like, partial [Daphnia pulex]|uniref:thioredoxin domain-containing protein 9-like n=1 Tax=Daphnia pulex TaxID=6669 RepID=UPI001EE03324